MRYERNRSAIVITTSMDNYRYQSGMQYLTHERAMDAMSKKESEAKTNGTFLSLEERVLRFEFRKGREIHICRWEVVDVPGDMVRVDD